MITSLTGHLIKEISIYPYNDRYTNWISYKRNIHLR